ncbi:MAG: hypothetical protein JW982_16440 [Spirochaetes bacterium]|nr:hypothetical protein [Spirochaetota bacterium]
MISMLMTFAGFIIAVAVFLYFINTLDSAKQGIQKLTNCEVEIEKKVPSLNQTGDAQIKDLSPEEKKFIPGRRCPLCSRILIRDEPLYATHVETAGVKKILIHGCPYCYKDSAIQEKA